MGRFSDLVLLGDVLAGLEAEKVATLQTRQSKAVGKRVEWVEEM